MLITHKRAVLGWYICPYFSLKKIGPCRYFNAMFSYAARAILVWQRESRSRPVSLERSANVTGGHKTLTRLAGKVVMWSNVTCSRISPRVTKKRKIRRVRTYKGKLKCKRNFLPANAKRHSRTIRLPFVTDYQY